MSTDEYRQPAVNDEELSKTIMEKLHFQNNNTKFSNAVSPFSYQETMGSTLKRP